MDSTLVDGKEGTLTVETIVKQENNEDDALTVKEETHEEQQDVKQTENNMVLVRPRKKRERKTESTIQKTAKFGPSEGFCLFVGHLNNSIKLEEIKNTLASFFTSHNVLAQDIKLHPTRKFGYVHFVSEEDSKKALQLNKSMVLNKPLRLAKPTKKKENNKVLVPGKRKATTSTRTLFVNNLGYNIKENDLKKVFPKAVSLNIPQKQGKSRGFAFVEFSSMGDAQAAMKASENKMLAKRQIRLELCPTKSQTDVGKVPLKTLRVTGLSEETTEETLQNAFEGAVSARLVTDRHTGVLLGYGFISFNNTDDCKAAKEAMEDCEIDGREVKIDYARSKKGKGKGQRHFMRGPRGQRR